MIYNYFLVIGAQCNSIGVRWFILCSSSWWQHSRIRCKMGWSSTFYVSSFYPMIYWKVCTHWEYVSPRNATAYWNCTTWRFIRRYRCPGIKNWRQRWRGNLSDISITKSWRQAWENWIRNCDKESKGINRRWRRKRCWLPAERKRPVFDGRPTAVSGTRVTIVHKHQNPNPRHFPSRQCHEVEVCRRKGVSKATVPWVHSSTTVQIIWRCLQAIALWILASTQVSVLQNTNGLQSLG